MKSRKYLIGCTAFILMCLGIFNGSVAAKPKRKMIMNRVIVNGKVIVDTRNRGKVMRLVKRYRGQTIVILPKSSYSGIWEQEPARKNMKRKTISVIVNGKPIIHSRIPSKINAVVSRNLGKRIVIKQKGQHYTPWFPKERHVVLKGPYSKDALSDYLQSIIAGMNAAQKYNKVATKWVNGEVQYYKYADGQIVSFSVQTAKDTRVQVVNELKHKDFVLAVDQIKNEQEIIQRSVNEYLFSTKSGSEVYEYGVKRVKNFSVDDSNASNLVS